MVGSQILTARGLPEIVHLPRDCCRLGRLRRQASHRLRGNRTLQNRHWRKYLCVSGRRALPTAGATSLKSLGTQSPLTSDPDNCGACGTSCKNNAALSGTCAASVCTCATGYTRCGTSTTCLVRRLFAQLHPFKPLCLMANSLLPLYADL